MKGGNVAIDGHGFASRRTTFLSRIAMTLACWRARVRSRHELARLDQHTQRDLGLSDADIWRETRKAPWQD